MMGLTYEDIVRILVEEKKVSEQEIQEKVKEKLRRLSGLISNEGAAQIVANEYGVDLLALLKKRGVKINKISPGMMGVSVVGKVVKVNEVHSFKKNDREGKVGSFLLGDETGILRVVLWDNQQLLNLEQGLIKENIALRVTNGYVRENNGFVEMHLNNKSELVINPEGVQIGEVVKQFSNTYVKKSIQELQENDFVAVSGTIVQVFEPRFYSACPQCSKKINTDCSEHGNVTPKSLPVLNFVIDDGTGNLRVVTFRDNVTMILDESYENVLKTMYDKMYFEVIKNKALGKQLTIMGKVNRNEVVDRLEMVMNKFEPLDPKALASELLKETNAA